MTSSIVSLPIVCFNPRTREGCDISRIRDIGKVYVSIHAPVRGATACYLGGMVTTSSFNPRTREGCDGNQASHRQDFPMFQSTHP